MIACPACKGDTAVRETRRMGRASRRRRVCLQCALRVATIEVIVLTPEHAQKILRFASRTPSKKQGS